MLEVNELLEKLGYLQSNYYRQDLTQFEPETAHFFRDALSVGVSGIYMFNTSPSDYGQPPRPAVFVAKAENDEEARKIHRKLWNLANAPLIVILTPNRVLVYTGFNYSQDVQKKAGFLDEFTFDENDLRRLLANLSADAINTGQIWRGPYSKELKSTNHIHARLLKSLDELGRLLQNMGLKAQVAHNLIGKFVYIRYLRDRQILSSQWLAQNSLQEADVLGRNATVKNLAILIHALEIRFNGKLFPIDFSSEDAPSDEHVSLTAAIFNGDQIIDAKNKTLTTQLHLDFQAYDFEYIPVETLSSVYEQFIEDKKESGAVYTSEILAEYVLSELETLKPLTNNTKVLDPACGSGVFLVLVYRRLIEQELTTHGNEKLTPDQLIKLLQNIYGVERELDACYITEFSLILTLLHYIDLKPPELQNLAFHFPSLHNSQIFHMDFFDFDGEVTDVNFWAQQKKFDWIVGNPPWIASASDSPRQKYVNNWLNNRQNKVSQPVGSRQIAEAFSWVVAKLLDSDSLVGLLLPATSLFNVESTSYRKRFFTTFDVLRLTNFANLREVLFKGRAEKPTAVFIYKLASDADEKPSIIHIAPFITNQLDITGEEEPWSIIIDENDVQTVKSEEAVTGSFLVWKIAMRGNYRDKRALKQIERLFPVRLGQLAKDRGWKFYQGTALRKPHETDPTKPLPNWVVRQQFDPKKMSESLNYFSIPSNSLKPISDEDANYRIRSGPSGLLVSPAPHLVIAASGINYAIYSDVDFFIPTPNIGISVSKEDANYLKALSLCLRASITYYYMFFYTSEWGVSKRARYISSPELKQLPVPNFTTVQIEELSEFWQFIVDRENQKIREFLQQNANISMFDNEEQTLQEALSRISPTAKYRFRTQLQAELRVLIDEKIQQLFQVSDELTTIVTEFVNIRFRLDEKAQIGAVIAAPKPSDLTNYGIYLRNYLDSFVRDGSHFRIKIVLSQQLIECQIHITSEVNPISVEVAHPSFDTTNKLNTLGAKLSQKVSQWIYVQRGLRVYDNNTIYIYKTAHLINWTRTQAMNDANDIIAQVLTVS